MIYAHNLLEFLPSKQLNYEPCFNRQGLSKTKLKGGKRNE